MRHLAVFEGAGASTFPTAIPAIADILYVQSNGFILTKSMFLYMCAAAGTNLTRAEFSTPTWAAINPYPLVRLNNGGSAFEDPPNVEIFDNPIPINVGDPLTLNANLSTGTTNVYGVVELGDTANEPIGFTGQVYRIRGTGATTLTANKWTQVTATWEQASLPSGTYMVVGLQGYSAGALALRVFNSNSPYRPGSLAYQSLGQRPHPYFGHQTGRNLLKFTAPNYPNVEYFSSSADTSEEFFLDVVRVAG